MEENLGGQNVVSTPETPMDDVTTDNGVDKPVVEQPVEDVNNTTPITYTKEQVIDMMKRRVDRSHNAFFKRYGVLNLEELDALFEKSNQFDNMNAEYGGMKLKLDEANRTISFLQNNVNPDKYDDIIAYFKGTNTEFSNDALIQALTTHPEWLKPSNVPATTTIESLGHEASVKPQQSEKELASKLFGVKL